MKKTLILMMLLLLAMSGCDTLEEVRIYHEPYLNIFANVTVADPELNYVYVYRTTGFGEPDRYELDSVIYHQFYNSSSGDTIRYQTFYIDTSYAVNDARVFFLHGDDTIAFVEKMQGVYLPTDTNFTIVTGEIYDLYVETETFGVATASEEALSPITWTDGETGPMLISLSDPSDSISWSNNGGAYKVIFYYTYHSSWGDWSYTYEFDNSTVREPFWKYDTSNYDALFNPDPFYEMLHDSVWVDTAYALLDTLELTVKVIAYSNSYLDYTSLQEMNFLTGFIRYPAINDFRINIENSLGAFTSMSISDERTVLFVR